jgi:hypothetical protein
LWTIIIGGYWRNINFESDFSEELKGKMIPSFWVWLYPLEIISKTKKEGRTPLGKRFGKKNQEPGEKLKIFSVYSLFYSFLILCCYLDMNFLT